MAKYVSRETLGALGEKLKDAFRKQSDEPTQYGNHEGYDAAQCLEKMSPHSTIGIPKGDRNRGSKT